jgi:MFS family permease
MGGVGVNTEFIVILVGVFVVALSWLLLRFGKVLARWALAFGALAAVVIVALALLSQASTSREAAKVATVASTGQAVTIVVSGLVIGGLLAALLAALAVIGWLALRLRLVESGKLLPPKRRQLPGYEPVVYIVQSNEPVSWEVDQWENGDWQF